jgi:hypothetical protein
MQISAFSISGCLHFTPLFLSPHCNISFHTSLEAYQDDLDEAFARDVEGAVARDESRGEISRPSGPAITPTPASRAKRVRRKAVVFEKGANRKS